ADVLRGHRGQGHAYRIAVGFGPENHRHRAVEVVDAIAALAGGLALGDDPAVREGFLHHGRVVMPAAVLVADDHHRLAVVEVRQHPPHQVDEAAHDDDSFGAVIGHEAIEAPR